MTSIYIDGISPFVFVQFNQMIFFVENNAFK